MLQEKINFEDAKNRALEFIKKNGPSLPSQVAKEIGIPPLFASALLSQLISEKSIKVSELKIGGSPLYYQETQKELLLNFTTFIPSIEKEMCEKLKKVGVIPDDGLSLQEKVALRSIRDFSIPLSVRIGQEAKIFWRWYSLPQEETSKLIERSLKNSQIQVQEQKAEVKEALQEVKPAETLVEVKAEVRAEGHGEENREEQNAGEGEEVQKVQAVQKKLRKAKEIDFLQEVHEFLAKNDVKIIEESVIRKNSEIELMLQLSSSLGRMNFFAIAKNKRILTPADLTLAYYRSQEKKLPLILLNSGKFAKKAEERAGELGITLKSLQE